jgi:aspartate racemase
MAIYSAPDIPDRTEFILGKSDKSPLPGIISAGKSLVSIGADVIAMPCVNAHYFPQ